jgi:hypothetical protein
MSQFEQVTEIAVEQQYDPRKNYTVYVNPENRHITGFVGFIVPVESLNDGAGWPSYNLQNLTKEEYSMLSMSINNKDMMAFLDEDNRTIHLKQFQMELLNNTYYDTNLKKMYGQNNRITLKIGVYDENHNICEDVTQIRVKNNTTGDDSDTISINSLEASQKSIYVPNGATCTFDLLKEGPAGLSLKAIVPGVDYLWLNIFPQLLCLNQEHLANLHSWIETQES